MILLVVLGVIVSRDENHAPVIEVTGAVLVYEPARSEGQLPCRVDDADGVDRLLKRLGLESKRTSSCCEDIVFPIGCSETIYPNGVPVRADHPNRAHQKSQDPNGCCQNFELR
jgi:hypothetical protein